MRGFGRQVPADPEGPAFAAVDMTKLEIVVPADRATEIVSAIERAAHTGRAGDGKIFTTAVDEAVRVRSGERDLSAL